MQVAKSEMGNDFEEQNGGSISFCEVQNHASGLVFVGYVTLLHTYRIKQAMPFHQPDLIKQSEYAYSDSDLW